MALAPDDTFLISSSTALGMAENLVILLNTVVKNLPEPELRQVRGALENSVRLADELLYNIAISSTFEMLTLSDVSTTLGENVFTASVASSRTHVGNTAMTTSIRPTPPPSPASVAVKDDVLKCPALNGKNPVVARQLVALRNVAPVPPALAVPADNQGEPDGDQVSDSDEPCLILSSRPNVGRPDYRLHPKFVRPGIPGPYQHPPVDPSSSTPAAYYVVTKGLYVGIFTSWSECSSWVIKVSASVFCKVRQWDEAKDLYNARLAWGFCEVLS